MTHEQAEPAVSASASAPGPPPPADAAAPATLGQRSVAWLIRAAATTLRILPAPLAYGLASWVAPILVWNTRRRDRRIGPLGRGLHRNQRIVFRDQLTPARSSQLLWGWARHMTQFAVDFCRQPKLTPENYRDFVDTSELQAVHALYGEGKGVICVTGHIGMWELCGHVAALDGLPLLSVSRPLENPALGAVLTRLRGTGGQRIITKWGVLWPLKKALARGEIIGMAADENAHDNPAFVPFLGTLAATNTTPALLATRSGSPIIVVSCQRVGRGRFKFRVWDTLRIAKVRAGGDADLVGITARINRSLTQAIQEYPEQWLWPSRRFANRPPDEVPGPDGLPPPVVEGGLAWKA